MRLGFFFSNLDGQFQNYSWMKASKWLRGSSGIYGIVFTLPVNQLVYVPLGNQNCPGSRDTIHGLVITGPLMRLTPVHGSQGFVNKSLNTLFQHPDERIPIFWPRMPTWFAYPRLTPNPPHFCCKKNQRPASFSQDNANIWMDRWIEDTLLKPSLEEQVWGEPIQLGGGLW